jgi:hypothetical protein
MIKASTFASFLCELYNPSKGIKSPKSFLASATFAAMAMCMKELLLLSFSP